MGKATNDQFAMGAMFVLSMICVLYGMDGAKDIVLLSLGAYAGFLKGKESD